MGDGYIIRCWISGKLFFKCDLAGWSRRITQAGCFDSKEKAEGILEGLDLDNMLPLHAYKPRVVSFANATAVGLMERCLKHFFSS